MSSWPAPKSVRSIRLREVELKPQAGMGPI